jgi:lipopolysaccharide biosynthesis glycosyltransferase
VQAKSIELHHSKYPLVVICTKNIESILGDTLTKEGIILKVVEPFDLSNQNSAIKEAWFKLYAWTLEEYDRLLYLDGDTMIVRNVDHLFKIDLNSYFGIAACKDWAKYRPYGEVQFNSGVMLLRPCKAVFDQMRQEMTKTELYQAGEFADQLFLNFFWGKRLHILPQSYNLLTTIQDRNPALWMPSEAYIIHFAGHTKPWKTSSTQDPLVKTWKDIRASLDKE